MRTRADVEKYFERYIERLDAKLLKLKALSNRVSVARVVAFLVTIAGLFLASVTTYYVIGLILTFISLAGFLALVFRHRKIEASRERFRVWQDIKREHLARCKIDWESIPFREDGISSDHAYAHDLDVIGEFSLHRLLDSSSSNGGSHRLLSWLTADSPDQQLIENRQALVKELIRKTRYRDRLGMSARLIKRYSSEYDEGDWILTWLVANKEVPALKLALVVSALLAFVTASLLGLSFLFQLPQIWIISFTIYVAVFLLLQLKLSPLLQEAMIVEQSLRRLAQVFHEIENCSYANTPHLRELCKPFLNISQKPSQHLARVDRIVTGASLRRNSLLWILANVILPWDLYFGYRFTSVKEALKENLPEWIDIWFQIEALSSISNFAHLNPEYVFPNINEENHEFTFKSRELGHPLIHHSDRICNDFEITPASNITLITGSNMSGKSTFLRTVGINLILANTGAPVCASEFTSSPLKIFSCIRIDDSVTDGFSYFYAEVRRLKSLLELLQDSENRPIIYFIDEIFRGTNNRERLIGSKSYIRELSKYESIGFISTHDLELVKLEDKIDNIANFHFREEIVNGSMHFDYKIQEGPCPTTNAIKIMKLEGLPIDFSEPENEE